MDFKILEHPFGKGSRSDRFLILENSKKSVIKITCDKECYIDSQYTPKLLSKNNPRFISLKEDKEAIIYQYEFIEGCRLSECLINDSLFIKIIEMLNYFFKNGFFVWDCHIDNIVVFNANPFFVDLGGIEKKPYNLLHYILEFTKEDCPEEFFAKDYPLSYNTEVFTIYWIAHQIKNRCRLMLTSKTINIFEKMANEKIDGRYKTFADIFKDLLS